MILPGLLWSVTLKFWIKNKTNITTTNKYYWQYQSEFPRKINLAKDIRQGIKFFCSCRGVLWWNSNTFHQTSIISVSRLSLTLCFSINSIFALLIANISTSVLMQTSVANWSSEDGNFTGSPCRRSSKSFQQINSLLHQKSCKIVTFALYAPTRHT